MADQESRRPVHPGHILGEEMAALGLSAGALARALDVPASRVNEIVQRQRGVTADTALRLARYFGSSPRFWLDLQVSFELRRAEQRTGAHIRRAVKPLFSLQEPNEQ